MSAKVMDCLFCTEEEPCVSHMPKAKAKRAPRKVAAVEQPIRVAPQPDASPSVPDLPTTRPRKSRFDRAASENKPVELSQDELIEREAMRNLFPILAPDEQRAYAKLVRPERTPQQVQQVDQIRRSLNANQ